MEENTDGNVFSLCMEIHMENNKTRLEINEINNS